jgi:hypothetical protein
VVPEQTVQLVARIAHARVLGISDHLEYVGDAFEQYAREVRAHRLKLGLEVNGADWVEAALALPVDYYLYHCRDRAEDYRGAERLAASGRPAIIAHPNAARPCFSSRVRSQPTAAWRRSVNRRSASRTR